MHTPQHTKVHTENDFRYKIDFSFHVLDIQYSCSDWLARHLIEHTHTTL